MIIKNSNLRRSIVSNRYKILGIIIGAILIFAVIQVLNAIAENSNKNSVDTHINQNIYNPSDTIIYGSDVPEKEQEINNNIIDTFMEYCNNKEIEKAYNLLTDECKEVMYPKIEYFKNNYINKLFSTKKIYNIQSWITDVGNTYKVRILEDMLSTGKVSEENTKEDYYTVVKKDNEYKLNINSYVGRNNIHKSKKVEDVEISIINKDIYMNYEIYNIEIKNNTDNTICLDTKQDTKSVYLSGNNNNTYRAFMYELSDYALLLSSHQNKNISIKFNKMHNPNVQVNKMIFTDIIKNYDEYKKLTNKKEYTNKIKMEIDL